MISYFRLTVNPSDDEALKRIINNPPRGIGDTTVGKITGAAVRLQCSMWEVMTHYTDEINVNKGTLNKLNMFVSMMLPILSLSFGTIAGLMRFTRAELTETLTSDYMLLARTKGLTRGQATVRHALRNSMVPILPMIIGEFIGILSGSLIIEKIFAIPGIGSVYVASIGLRDYNVFMAVSMFYTIVSLVAGLIIDLSYGFIDPRIRMGGGKTNEY